MSSWSYDIQRGAHLDSPEWTPSVLRTLYDNSPSLFDSGLQAGISDCTHDRTDRRAYEAHRRIAAATYGVSPISKAYSDGYVKGFNATLVMGG